METVNQIKERLSAKSRTATLDELRSEGRKQVRLIRAEHIAAMVSQAVHAAIEDSGLIDPGEHEQLVEKSREEFKAILDERQEEARHAREIEEQLEVRQRELDDIKGRFEELTHSLTTARTELDRANDGSEGVREELEKALAALAAVDTEAAAASAAVERAKAEADEARAEAEKAKAEATQAKAEAAAARAEAAEAKAATQAATQTAPAAAAPSNELLMSLFQEMATMKANMQSQPAAQAPAAGADFGAALEKLTSSLNDRLENIGKKMGVSSAVDSDTPVDFSGMFKDSDEALESNMDNIVIKKKAAGGIAANLERLKRLKGGG